MAICSRLFAVVAVLLSLVGASTASAQQEFPPPQGKGRVVVLASGQSGPSHYTEVSRDIAALGYDVVLFDTNAWPVPRGDGLKAAIAQAQQMPHALPGRVALVGFSLGGGVGLYFGVQMPDQVAGAVLWYPVNQWATDPAAWAKLQKIPLLVFGGGQDHYSNDCCTAAMDQTLAKAATAAGSKFDLIVYPDAGHDFSKDGFGYNPKDYDDAVQRMAAQLKIYFNDN